MRLIHMLYWQKKNIQNETEMQIIIITDRFNIHHTPFVFISKIFLLVFVFVYVPGTKFAPEMANSIFFLVDENEKGKRDDKPKRIKIER